jgi:SAM-dependent methyltransferase
VDQAATSRVPRPTLVVTNELALSRWQDLVRKAGEKPGNRLWNARYLFEGVPLQGKTVLDIGCGAGWDALYAACCGAARVVGLEPTGPGSAPEAARDFQRRAAALGLENVELVEATLQEYTDEFAWDVILSHASINHLDEAATARLHVDEAARSVYRELFDRIASLSRIGGNLIIADCDRHNVFPRLGLRNPLAPSIEWHKHQHPRLWAALLSESGFRDPRIRWMALNSLRTPGRAILGNRVGAYLLASAFTLTTTFTGAGGGGHVG